MRLAPHPECAIPERWKCAILPGVDKVCDADARQTPRGTRGGAWYSACGRSLLPCADPAEVRHRARTVCARPMCGLGPVSARGQRNTTGPKSVRAPGSPSPCSRTWNRPRPRPAMRASNGVPITTSGHGTSGSRRSSRHHTVTVSPTRRTPRVCRARQMPVYTVPRTTRCPRSPCTDSSDTTSRGVPNRTDSAPSRGVHAATASAMSRIRRWPRLVVSPCRRAV